MHMIILCSTFRRQSLISVDVPLGSQPTSSARDLTNMVCYTHWRVFLHTFVHLMGLFVFFCKVKPCIICRLPVQPCEGRYRRPALSDGCLEEARGVRGEDMEEDAHGPGRLAKYGDLQKHIEQLFTYEKK